MWKRSSLKSFELNNQLQAKVYPNPASKDVWIEIGSLNNEKLTIIFNDMTGKQVLIQINISNEANKNGFTPSSFTNELNNLLNFKNIEIRGLMAMNAHLSSKSTLDENFRIMRNLLSLLQNQRPNAEFDLSMGMSSDYCAALQRGSTMIRIGKALFG